MDIDSIPVSLQGRIMNNAVKSALAAVFSLLEVLPFCLMNLPYRSILRTLKCNKYGFERGWVCWMQIYVMWRELHQEELNLSEICRL